MRVVSVILILLSSVIINVTLADVCPDGLLYMDNGASSDSCFTDMKNLVDGLSAMLTSPQSVITNGFAFGGSSQLFDVCSFCYDTYIQVVPYLYSLGAQDPTCSALAAGFEFVCIKNTETDTYCGDFDFPNTCGLDATCCIPSLRAFLTAAGSTALAPLVAYSSICPGEGLVAPSIDNCEFPDGTQVASDFSFRYGYKCNADTVSTFLNELDNTEALSGYTDDELATCVTKTKLLISTLSDAYVAEGSTSYATVCDDCTEVVNALGIKLAEYESDPYCKQALGALELGCKFTGDSYCGDAVLSFDENNCTRTSPAGCCIVEAYDYYDKTYAGDNSTAATQILADLSEAFVVGTCELTANDFANGISSCSLQSNLNFTTSSPSNSTNSTDSTPAPTPAPTPSPASSAFAVSMHSIFMIVVVSIATALLMID